MTKDNFPLTMLRCTILLSFIICRPQDPRYKDDLDRMVGYSTDSLLSMPIRSADGDIIGVVQVINKNTVEGYFEKDDEKVPDYFLCTRPRQMFLFLYRSAILLGKAMSQFRHRMT